MPLRESPRSLPLPFRLVAYLQKRNRLKDLENELTVTKGEGLVGIIWRDRLRVWGRHVYTAVFKLDSQGFPDSSVGKETTCNARDPGLIPGSGRSTG